MPEWPNLKKLADELGVTPEQIIGDEEVPDPSQLDRIEEKLDELLSLAKATATPAQIAKAAASRIEALPDEAQSTPTPKRKTNPGT